MILSELLKVVLYGVVEGITEWLPISSTGHMLLLRRFVNLDVTDAFWDMFLVVIQFGAILAVCATFFRELNPFLAEKSEGERRLTQSLWKKIIVACLPAAIIGIPFDDWIEEHLGGPFVIAAALIAYGIVFILIETSRERRAAALNATGSTSSPALIEPVVQSVPRPPSASHTPSIIQSPGASSSPSSSKSPRHMAGGAAGSAGRGAPAADKDDTETDTAFVDRKARVQSIEELDWKTAVGIGLFQMLSMVPGTSRSGSTIIGGLILGCTRAVAAEFTFYLAVPVMVGASVFRLLKYFIKGNMLVPMEALTLLVGCLVAFLVSLPAIHFLMGFVKKHDYKPFGWYRIALGIVVIAYFSTESLVGLLTSR